MRYAVLSDVHGNLHALEAVVAAAQRAGVDGWLCAGDVVGYGAFPVECVARLRELDALCVAGNHELLALGRLDEARTGGLARGALPHTRAALDNDARAWLGGLPAQVEADGVTVAHGSLDDAEEYVRSTERAAALVARVQGRGLVLGHTHQPWLWEEGRGSVLRDGAGTARLQGRFLLNPGSVGQSRSASPAARFAVLDLGRDEVELVAVDYDRQAARAALRRAGLPPDSYHPGRGLLRRAVGRLRAGRSA